MKTREPSFPGLLQHQPRFFLLQGGGDIDSLCRGMLVAKTDSMEVFGAILTSQLFPA